MPRRPKCIVIIVDVLAVVCLACVAWSANAEVVVRDDTGAEVRLAAPASRIVSLAPHITELLFEIGAGDRIVAATEYSDYPDAARRIRRVGGLSGIDLERIVALKPDLVIAWQSGTSATQLDALQRLHVPVYRNEPHTFADVAETMRRFGALTGRVDQADAVATRFATDVAALRDRYAGRRPVRVFYQVWNKPLMTLGGPQLITQAIEACGGHNVFASLKTLAPIVDVEAVIEADPQLIVTTSTGTDHRDDIAAWSRWTGVSAVTKHRYLFMDPGQILQQTSRMLIGTAQLCHAIEAARE